MPFIPPPKVDRIKKFCFHPEHNPPTHIALPPGFHTWKCPACGKETTFRVGGHIDARCDSVLSQIPILPNNRP